MGSGLLVNEIFHSLQGESSRAGTPATFVRLTGCNLRCAFCDTKYAYESGDSMEINDIIERVAKFGCKTVEITGGEPMLQGNTVELAQRLLNLGYGVMMETNGTINLKPLPEEVVKIVDIKCPGSGSGGAFLYENLSYLTQKDEIKFVVSSKDDFNWAMEEIKNRNLLAVCTVNISPAEGKVEPKELARLILESGKNIRLNLQLHKILGLP